MLFTFLSIYYHLFVFIELLHTTSNYYSMFCIFCLIARDLCPKVSVEAGSSTVCNHQLKFAVSF